MTDRPAWVNDDNAALLTDLYELTMLRGYAEASMLDEAVFDLFIRDLPEDRNYLVAAGLDDALRYLETLSFSEDALSYLASRDEFCASFIDWLREFRFEGDVYAVPEGTVVFAGEPLIEVVAPMPQAQLVESFLMNQMSFQTTLASKAARVIAAAGDAAVVDFGMRRMHGTDAAMKAARAFHIAGLDATSNVLAGRVYGLPISGTTAHSYIEAHDDEMTAFRNFASIYPDTVLLVDTYDTLEGVRKVVDLAAELGDDFRVRAVRLDSGDLLELSKQTRQILDEAGLHNVGIFASGGLDEHSIAHLLERGAPIDGFGVGTRLGVSSDAPVFDSAYKLVAYAGRGRMKLSTDKATLPGRKQVFRVGEGTAEAHDVLALHDESINGRPLLVPVMRGGKRLDAGRETLETMRKRARREIESLPGRLRNLESAEPPYEIRISDRLEGERDRLREELMNQASASRSS
jgi:nicotinate phosphoribosyltransferase